MQQHSKHGQVEIPKNARESNIGEKESNGADHANEHDTFNGGTSPIPLPALPHSIRNKGELYYQ